MALDYQTNNPISRKSCTMNNHIILYSMINIFYFFFFCRFLTVLFSLKLHRVSFLFFNFNAYFIFFYSDFWLLHFIFLSFFVILQCFYIISCFDIFICVPSIFGMIHLYDIYIYAKFEFTKIFKMHVMIHKRHHIYYIIIFQIFITVFITFSISRLQKLTYFNLSNYLKFKII